MLASLAAALCCGGTGGLAVLRGQSVTNKTITINAAEFDRSPFQAQADSRLKALAVNQPMVQFLPSLTNLPSAIRKRLEPVADAGQPFSIGCVGSEPHVRFLAATRAGATYNVGLEYGGIVHNWRIVQFVVDDAGAVIEEKQLEPRAAR